MRGGWTLPRPGRLFLTSSPSLPGLPRVCWIALIFQVVAISAARAPPRFTESAQQGGVGSDSAAGSSNPARPLPPLSSTERQTDSIRSDSPPWISIQYPNDHDLVECTSIYVTLVRNRSAVPEPSFKFMLWVDSAYVASGQLPDQLSYISISLQPLRPGVHQVAVRMDPFRLDTRAHP